MPENRTNMQQLKREISQKKAALASSRKNLIKFIDNSEIENKAEMKNIVDLELDLRREYNLLVKKYIKHKIADRIIEDIDNILQ